MSNVKYYVWARGMWREVNLRTGRVQGWRRRPRFVYLREGRLRVASTERVLRALSALAAGEPSEAKDGPRLPFRKHTREHRGHREQPGVDVISNHIPCCAAHRCTRAVEPRTRDASTQHGAEDALCPDRHAAATGRPPPGERRAPSGERVSSLGKREATLRERGASPRKHGASPGKRGAPSSAPGGIRALLKRRSRSASSEQSLTIFQVKKSLSHTKSAPPTDSLTADPAKRRRVENGPKASKTSLDVQISTKNRSECVRTTRLGSQAGGQIAAVSSDDDHVRRQRDSKSVKLKKNLSLKKPSPVKKPQIEISLNVDTCKSPNVFSRNVERAKDRSSRSPYLELVIPDADVDVLRAYIERTGSADLEKYDTHDEYKRQVFYRINPLVDLERCAALENALRQRQQTQFAAQLGLRSASRGSAHGSEAHRRDSTTRGDGGADLEEPDRIKTKKTAKAAAQEPEGRDAREAVPLNESNKGTNTNTHRRRGADGAKDLTAAADGAALRADCKENVRGDARLRPHTISRRSTCRSKEYSNLEDHAIVAWLTVDSRARCVNGNRVWRSLQEQFGRLTGRERSWHSLRNRYLRYILPALGKLHLPPAQASRLRAAAATGELKTKRRVARRNSIFSKEPDVRGASSRRPPHEQRRRGSSADRAPAAPGSPPTFAPRRSLRSSSARRPSAASASAGADADSAESPSYSDVTRRFASRRLRSTPREAGEAEREPAPGARPVRTRKLFNPNALP